MTDHLAIHDREIAVVQMHVTPHQFAELLEGHAADLTSGAAVPALVARRLTNIAEALRGRRIVIR